MYALRISAMALALLWAGCIGLEAPEGEPGGAVPGAADGFGSEPSESPEPFAFVTYNAGLAHGAVPLAEQRLPMIVEALRETDADVLCLQEVWHDEDAEAIQQGLGDVFPYSIREASENNATESFECNPFKVWSMKSCVDSECTPHGISLFECIEDQCADEYDELSEECQLCLAANTTSPIRCVTIFADEYAYEGRNGLLLLSRHPMEAAWYMEFESYVVQRSMLSATIGPYYVQCTHLAADLGRVPYPRENGDHVPTSFTSWEEEQRAQVDAIAADAEDGMCTVLMGDMNTGPATDMLAGELEANYLALGQAGYQDPWPQADCTMCRENSIAGGTNDVWIDHVFFRGCSGEVAYERILDQPVELQAEAGPIDGRLSDHYGLRAWHM